MLQVLEKRRAQRKLVVARAVGEKAAAVESECQVLRKFQAQRPRMLKRGRR